MLRTAGLGCLVLFVCQLESAAVPDTVNPDKPSISKAEAKARELRARLDEPANLDKGVDANTPLQDVLEFFSDRYDIPIVVDDKAFEAIGVQKIAEQPVSLPKLIEVSRATALHMLLAQIMSDKGERGTFLLRHDHVLVTTTWHATPARWTQDRPGIPHVDLALDRRPVDEALREVTALTGINVVVDVPAVAKARKTITAVMNNTRVDTAVRVLAEMAELKSVAVDNVLFVTTPDKAKQLQAEQDAIAAKQRDAAKAEGKKE
jgi:hypothetical protein